MNNGWISLHRKIKDHWIWEGKPFSYGQAWIDIIMECNHSSKKQLIKKQLIITDRGQSSNSLKTWAVRWGWSVTATRHFLDLLKKDEMINTENAQVTTRLTVLNYDTYQSKPHAADTMEVSQEDRRKIAGESQEIDKQQLSNGNNGNNGVLRTHEAFRSISTKKPSNHEIMQLTQLTHDYNVETVLAAIVVMGDRSWHSIGTLKKVLSGELPKPEEGEPMAYDPEAMV